MLSLIRKCLQKVRTEQSTVVLMAPLWQNQLHPLVCLNRLRLAAWRVSGSNIKQQEFQRKLLNYSWPVGAKERTQLTNLDGSDGVAGVRDGKLIPFLQECSHS